jgi:Uma2 family endonuclease
MARIVELPLVRKIPIVYPASDGDPMGETEWHVLWTLRLLHALRERYRDRTDVHVGGNLFIYFGEGEPTDVVCPDVFVAFGARPGLRRVWKTWEEGGLFPQVIFELISDESRSRDLGPKRGLYEVLGVRDYFAFDPTGEALDPPLRGWRRAGEVLVPIDAEPGATRRLRSDALGLFVQQDEERLRLVDVRTGERLPFPEEEAEARRQAEAEAGRLRRRIERLKPKR